MLLLRHLLYALCALVSIGTGIEQLIFFLIGLIEPCRHRTLT